MDSVNPVWYCRCGARNSTAVLDCWACSVERPQPAEVVQLRTVRHNLSADTAKYLRELATRCDSGDVIAVTTIVEFSTGTYTVEGTGTLSRLQTIGVLFEAAMKRSA